jgi:2-polyprenyl-3-methyl-5-hydroxy-6-metoxy-1,4-benzoquinol methylase
VKQEINIQNCPLCDSTNQEKFLDVKDNMITQEDFTIVKCNDCGFRFTNPRPSQETIGRYYQDEKYVSHSSTKKGLINWLYNLVRNRTLNQKVNLIGKRTIGKSLIDIGAGTGHFLARAKLKGFDVKGFEPDDIARANALDQNNLNLLDLSELKNVQAKSVDVVSMWHVAEHLYDVKEEMTQIASKLKTSGILVIAVPNLEALDAKVYGAGWAAYDVPRHLSHFSKKDIDFLAQTLNMKCVEVLPMKFDSFYVSMLSERYKKGSLLKAFWNGLKSNLNAKVGGFSSQIYILRFK